MASVPADFSPVVQKAKECLAEMVATIQPKKDYDARREQFMDDPANDQKYCRPMFYVGQCNGEYCPDSHDIPEDVKYQKFDNIVYANEQIVEKYNVCIHELTIFGKSYIFDDSLQLMHLLSNFGFRVVTINDRGRAIVYVV